MLQYSSMATRRNQLFASESLTAYPGGGWPNIFEAGSSMTLPGGNTEKQKIQKIPRQAPDAYPKSKPASTGRTIGPESPQLSL